MTPGLCNLLITVRANHHSPLQKNPVVKRMGMYQHVPDSNDLRRHPRVRSLNIVYYALFDADGKKTGRGKGRILNLSKKGALLETQVPLEGSFIVLLAAGPGGGTVDGGTVKVKGRIANTRKSGPHGIYHSGIEFIGSQAEQVNAIVALVKAYNNQRHKEPKN